MNIQHRETRQTIVEVEGSLIGKRLSDINLAYADLRAQKLESIVLIRDDFSYSDLTYAEMAFASIHNTDFSYANMTETTLCEATLADSVLFHADLARASLQYADLTRTNFDNANLTGAVFKETLLADCKNLHKAIGLAEIEHEGPSVLDVRTLRSSILYLPDVFLYGVGYSQGEVSAMRTFYLKTSD